MAHYNDINLISLLVETGCVLGTVNTTRTYHLAISTNTKSRTAVTVTNLSKEEVWIQGSTYRYTWTKFNKHRVNLKRPVTKQNAFQLLQIQVLTILAPEFLWHSRCKWEYFWSCLFLCKRASIKFCSSSESTLTSLSCERQREIIDEILSSCNVLSTKSYSLSRLLSTGVTGLSDVTSPSQHCRLFLEMFVCWKMPLLSPEP